MIVGVFSAINFARLLRSSSAESNRVELHSFLPRRKVPSEGSHLVFAGSGRGSRTLSLRALVDLSTT